MKFAALLALGVSGVVAAGFVGLSGAATAGPIGCSAGSSSNGYTYAGHAATYRGHGVRATISLQQAPGVAAGHVAGWVGVGGPGQGPNGEDAWIQAGLGSTPGKQPFLYGEIMRPGTGHELLRLVENVPVGREYRIAVLEVGARPGWWRIWVDGRPATQAIHLPGSSGRWAPIATAESWNARQSVCNRFTFRFERVSVSYGGGGTWRPFVPGYQFLDRGYQLRSLAISEARPGAYRRPLADGAPMPYAFVATS